MSSPSSRPAPVRVCANHAYPHTARHHAHGLCLACLVYQRRHGRPRPAELIAVHEVRRAAKAPAQAGGVA